MRIKFIPSWFILCIILLSTFLLKLRNLDHTSITHWDEVFHALVAQNLLKHPLKPTLIDAPYLPYDYTNWRENHVWLHKPILPLWQIAISFAIFGVNTFALRLPAALLSTGAAWLTYLIGKELVGRSAGLIAALLQAANPFLMTLVQGYQFADNIDIAVLFWVELGMYFLVRAIQTGAWRYVIGAGVCEGLGFLSKSYLAAIIFGVALTVWLLPLCRLGQRADNRFRFAHLFVLAYATLLTVAPWVIYCLVNYPQEFWQEEEHTWQHLNTGLGPWGAPWTKVAYDYLISIYGVFYSAVIVAAIVFLGRAFARKQTGLWLLLAWGLGVIIPHLLATTKTPSATILAMPPFLLLVGYMISETWRGQWAPLAALTGVMAMSVIDPAVVVHPQGENPVLNGNMQTSGWLFIHLAGALEVVAVVGIVRMVTSLWKISSDGVWLRAVRWTATAFALGVFCWLGFRMTQTSWQVTNADVNDPNSQAVGLYARANLPANAVLLCEEYRGYEHLTMMFYADRTCYALGGSSVDNIGRRLQQAGAIPYVVSYRPLPFEVVTRINDRGPTVYRWR